MQKHWKCLNVREWLKMVERNKDGPFYLESAVSAKENPDKININCCKTFASQLHLRFRLWPCHVEVLRQKHEQNYHVWLLFK